MSEGFTLEMLAEEIANKQDQISSLRHKIANLNSENEQLRGWKASQLKIEAEWEPQKVANLLSVPLGKSIRKSIFQGIIDLLEENSSLKAENELLKEDQKRAELSEEVLSLKKCIQDMLREDVSRTHCLSPDMGGNSGLTIRVQQGEKGKAWHQTRAEAVRLSGK